MTLKKDASARPCARRGRRQKSAAQHQATSGRKGGRWRERCDKLGRWRTHHLADHQSLGHLTRVELFRHRRCTARLRLVGKYLGNTAGCPPPDTLKAGRLAHPEPTCACSSVAAASPSLRRGLPRRRLACSCSGIDAADPTSQAFHLSRRRTWSAGLAATLSVKTRGLLSTIIVARDRRSLMEAARSPQWVLLHCRGGSRAALFKSLTASLVWV